ncbi:hypothetical protein HK102_011230 [Quaeritorhiza haematococci]|nr:hypothetical protein HK102_011230 [Quaeritorhiza haematococci]
MIEIWGYRLAERPNDKSIKASFRSGKHQCVIHDASYWACMELKGHSDVIRTLMATVTDPTMTPIGSSRFISGHRQGSIMLYDYLQYPRTPISPCNFLWRQSNTASSSSTSSSLWIWIHPAAQTQLSGVLDRAIAALGLKEEITKSVLESDLVKFELTGPRSHAVLQEVLNVCGEESQGTKGTPVNVEAQQLWNRLSHLRTPASLPPGVVLGLTIHDPRLSFPPKMPPRSADIPTGSSTTIQSVTTDWPRDNVAWSPIWDTAIRVATVDCKPAEKDLNRRRSQALVPGTPLTPDPTTDVRIPILLLQRNTLHQHHTFAPTASSPSSASLPKESREFVCGWDIIAPKGWAPALWNSFIFAGARAIGLRERHSLHFESGLPCFPYDYPGTAAYAAWSVRRKREEEDEWRRKPKGKRVNFNKLGVPSPFEAGFWGLVGAEGEGGKWEKERAQNAEKEQVKDNELGSDEEVEREGGENDEDLMNVDKEDVDIVNKDADGGVSGDATSSADQEVEKKNNDKKGKGKSKAAKPMKPTADPPATELQAHPAARMQIIYGAKPVDLFFKLLYGSASNESSSRSSSSSTTTTPAVSDDFKSFSAVFAANFSELLSRTPTVPPPPSIPSLTTNASSCSGALSIPPHWNSTTLDYTSLPNVRLLSEPSPVKATIPDPLFGGLDTAFVRCRLTLLRRGVPGNNAIVYAADAEAYEFWLDAIKKRKDDGSDEEDKNMLVRLESFLCICFVGA